MLSPISMGHSNLFSAAISSFKHWRVGRKSRLINPNPVTLSTWSFLYKKKSKIIKGNVGIFNVLITNQDILSQMKIQFHYLIVGVQCAALLNLLISPNFPISKFYCCQGTASLNFSMMTNSQCVQFGSIVNRDV